MQTKKRLLTLALSGVLLAGTCVPTLAATVHYNDGATVGGSALGGKSYLFAALLFGGTLLLSLVGLLIYRGVCRHHEKARKNPEEPED